MDIAAPIDGFAKIAIRALFVSPRTGYRAMQTEHENTLEENDMEMGRKYWLTSAVVAGLFLVTGCSDPGPAEEAGEQVDETVEETGEAAEETAQEAEDAIDPPGPAERAGRKIDEAVEGTREKIDEMTDN